MNTLSLAWKFKPIRWIKTIFVILLIVSLVICGGLFFSMRLFALFPIPSVGGIVISAQEIDGSNFSLAQSSSLTEQQANYPTAKLSTDTIQFPYGLTISKILDFSATPLASYGISKVLMKFTIHSTQSATNTSLQVSGIQSDQVNFTTGYDTNGNPVITNTDGTQQPLSDVSSLSFDTLTNATLNIHAINLNSFDWGQFTIQVIPMDASGNPIRGTNGSFTYDPTYENRQIVP